MAFNDRLTDNGLQMDRELTDEASNLLVKLLIAAYNEESGAVGEILESERRRLNEEVTQLQESLSTMLQARKNFPDELASIKKIHETTKDIYAKRHNR